MIELRPFAKLGAADHGWLKAKHHFSFGSHYDPGNMGHGALRVWNDDEIAPNTGFPAHPHANMEIITYVREGAITHQDSLGNKGRTEAGDVQVMSAGSGIRHSEYNLEPTTTRIFQIWIEPTTEGGQPTWGAKPFPKSNRSGRFVTLASGFADDDRVVIGEFVDFGDRRGLIDLVVGGLGDIGRHQFGHALDVDGGAGFACAFGDSIRHRFNVAVSGIIEHEYFGHDGLL